MSFSILSANVLNSRISTKTDISSSFSGRISAFLEDDFAVLMMKCVYKIAGYPVIILFCWGPSLIYDVTESTKSSQAVDFCNFFIPGLQGLLATLVFVVTNREAKSYIVCKCRNSLFHQYDCV